jgi:hypothetical protein
VVVRVILGDAGAVAAVEGVLSTLDDAASACVGDAARGLQFSPTTRPGFAVVYPYVFVSGSTPPEVTRALKLRYGLAKEDLDANLADPKKPPPPGVVVTF